MLVMQDRLEGTQVDAEQQKKYEEILELLLAAGYFRARIKGLRPFDKVIGGTSAQNIDEARRRVPSPPKAMTKSMARLKSRYERWLYSCGSLKSHSKSTEELI